MSKFTWRHWAEEITGQAPARRPTRRRPQLAPLRLQQLEDRIVLSPVALAAPSSLLAPAAAAPVLPLVSNPLDPTTALHFTGGSVSPDTSLTNFLTVKLALVSGNTVTPVATLTAANGGLQLQGPKYVALYSVPPAQQNMQFQADVLVVATDLGARTFIAGAHLNVSFTIDNNASIRALVLQQQGANASAIASALKSEFALPLATTAQILFNTSFSATDTMTALQSTYSAGATAAAQALQQAGYLATDTAGALTSVFSQTVAQVVQTLTSAGYTPTQVGGVLQSVFNETAAQATAVLQAAGIPVISIGTVLKNVYNQTAQAAVQTLQGAGFLVGDLAAVLQSAYNQSAQAAAQTLKAIAVGAGDIASALK